jgi:antitoxin component HigA of HigAB toxin-antitoxin module
MRPSACPSGTKISRWGLTQSFPFAKFPHTMTVRPTGRHQLRAWLHRSRQKQKDLAAQLGITDAYLSQILSGQRRAKLETLLRIEDVTGVPVVSWADMGFAGSDEPSDSAPNGPNLQRVK